jgi:hypothetical protein
LVLDGLDVGEVSLVHTVAWNSPVDLRSTVRPAMRPSASGALRDDVQQQVGVDNLLNVDRNADELVRQPRTNPTVSDSNTVSPPGSGAAGGRAGSRTPTSTARLHVSWLSKVDLPARVADQCHGREAAAARFALRRSRHESSGPARAVDALQQSPQSTSSCVSPGPGCRSATLLAQLRAAPRGGNR